MSDPYKKKENNRDVLLHLLQNSRGCSSLQRLEKNNIDIVIIRSV